MVGLENSNVPALSKSHHPDCKKCLALFELPSHSRKSARHFLLATSSFSTEQKRPQFLKRSP